MFLKKLLFIFFLGFSAIQIFAIDTTQHVVAGRVNSPDQLKKPYLVLISADGFRYDFAKKYKANNLLQLVHDGVSAAYLQSSYPSLTFPNHYSITCGLYPAHNGLVDNSFYDRDRKELYEMGNKEQVTNAYWYHGTPLWSLAESQGMLTASYYWPATETEVAGYTPTYYYPYNSKTPIDQRIDAVKNWLDLPEEQRPHFVSFYFPQVDEMAHLFGPDAPETGIAVRYVDSCVGALVGALATTGLPINYIFVSDHGMLTVDNVKTLHLPSGLEGDKFIIPQSTALVQLYAKDKSAIKKNYRFLKMTASGYHVYLKNKTPKHWHYRDKDDRYGRIGDIILVPKKGRIFNLNAQKVTKGKHGFDPKMKEMRASFYCWGPAFHANMQISGFENVNVFPLMAQLLGLSYNFEIDGDLSVLAGILNTP